jgi:chromosome partitioning protein
MFGWLKRIATPSANTGIGGSETHPPEDVAKGVRVSSAGVSDESSSGVGRGKKVQPAPGAIASDQPGRILFPQPGERPASFLSEIVSFPLGTDEVLPRIKNEGGVSPISVLTRVIAVVAQKGGAGKTTIAAHLAVRASQVRRSAVILADTDPQGSLSQWRRARKDDSLVLEAPRLEELVADPVSLRRRGAELVMIDTPPALTKEIEQVIALADLVLVPVRPSPHDLRAIGATVELIRRARKRFVFIVNGAAPRAKITAEAVAALSEHGPVAPVILYQRIEYAASMIDGRTVLETAPSGRSAQEISELWRYISAQISMQEAA